MSKFLTVLKKHLYDGILLLCLLALSLGTLAFTFKKEEAKSAKVYCQNEVVLTIDLSKDGLYYVEGKYNLMSLGVEDGSIYVRESLCPSQSCVHQGKISRSGQSIICAYNQVSILISGDSFEVDI